MKEKAIDRKFLFSVGLLLVAGTLIFLSASMGLLTRGTDTQFSSVAFRQIVLSLLPGIVLLLVFSQINYKIYRKYAFYIFIFSIVATLLVFVPGLGMSHGGARRWIYVGSLTFQTSELLKLGFVIYFAAWLSGVKDKVSNFRYGPLFLVALIAVCGAVLVKQPDTDAVLILFLCGGVMLLAAGGKWRHLLILLLAVALGVSVLALTRPYVKSRITTFMNPASDPAGAGYHIQQSLIAIGSGGITGRGFGKSLQKFTYLPEPIGDSIFAVAAEEFGFMGSVALISLFLYFTFRGMKISVKSPDLFGGLLALGIVILIISSSFINMGSMLAVLPLSGSPLLFVSQGGSALICALAEVGIVLNISKHRKQS